MIKINEVNINSASWNNVAQIKDWNTVRLCNQDWNTLKMTALTGTTVKVEVTVIENTWELLKESYLDWGAVSGLLSWAALKII